MTTKKTDMDEMTSTELDEVTGGEGVAGGGVAGAVVGGNAVEAVVPKVNRPVAPIAPTVTEPWTGPLPGKR
jgi:hypothetical protein